MSEAVESKTLVALGSKDDRYQTLCAGDSHLAAFLERFTSMVGERVTPSAIARREPGEIPTAEAVINFRNAVAVPVLLKAWADLSRNDQNPGALFAEYFEVHPAMGADVVGERGLGQAHELVAVNAAFVLQALVD